ncbi:MAG: metal ABC transporter solute-binding protein, Zn/Mn family [Nitrosopumilaceae archaeon]
MKSNQKIGIIGGVITAAIIIAVVMASTNVSQQTNSPSVTSTTKLKVIASFFPMYEFTRNVAGDKADVSVFIPIGEEPHGWEPPTQQIQDVQNAQLFIYNGYGMEAFVPEFLSTGNFPNTTFVKASQGIQVQDADVGLMDPGEAKSVIEQGGKDPHVWNDPILAQQEVRNIANAMEKADPTNAQYYETNANTYIAKLAKLDQDIKSGLSNCQTHTFVSFHNAFNYFSQRYNLTDVWVSGLAPEAEVSPQDLAKVENIAKENHVKIIFSEDLIDPKLAQSLATDVGATTRVLSPLEGINDTEQKEGITFIDKWYKNFDNLKAALECQ